MLLTSCKDNICRIWAETVLPDDGLVDQNLLDPSSAYDGPSMFHTQKHKKRFVQRLQTIRYTQLGRGMDTDYILIISII